MSQGNKYVQNAMGVLLMDIFLVLLIVGIPFVNYLLSH